MAAYFLRYYPEDCILGFAMVQGGFRWIAAVKNSMKVKSWTILRGAKPMPSPATNRRHAPIRALYAGTALLILVLLATNAAVLLHLRQSELLHQEDRLRTLSLIMAEQAERTFQDVDLVISSLARKVADDGVTDGDSFDRKMAGYGIHLLLQEKITGVPQLDAVAVVNHVGKLINFSRFWPVPEADVTDRDYFQAMKSDPNMKSYVSAPVRNRVTGTWIIFLAHRVSGTNGEFLGIVLGAIKLSYFEDFYQAISLGKDSSLAIHRLDGVLLVRFPLGDAIGKIHSSAAHLLPDGISGTATELGIIDGQMRIKAAHRLVNYPVFAVATDTEDAALAGWWNIARLMSLGALGCAVSIAVAAFAFGRQWRQQATLAQWQAELRGQEERTAAMRTAVDVAQATALQMAYSAEHDSLTGLPNRMLLNDRITQAIALARRNKRNIAVLFLDLDGFKHINDSLGHPIGDKLLQSISKRLVACMRDSDTVSRQGGDEFVVLLADMEQSESAVIAAKRILQAVVGAHSIDQHDFHIDAAIAASRILNAVGVVNTVDHHEFHVTASIGVSVYPDDGLDAETLIKNADTAMYQAKENGRQSYQFFTPAMNARAVERQSIEEDLRRALVKREFALHYQPIVNLRTGAITGVEALIRWMHPTRGMIPPAQFIPIAEDSGLILPIGAWALSEACRQARAWIDAGLPAMTMAVNVSAVEFRDKNFPAGLFAILGATGLDPKALELELTETVLMRHADTTASQLQILRGRGVRVAIDDFGTGYSSLSYLQKFPLDALKIDQSFVRQISTPGGNTAIVIAVIAMARSLNLRVVAEGVETQEELAFLQARQCDEAQGYYFSPAVPPEQFAKLVETGILEAARRLRDRVRIEA